VKPARKVLLALAVVALALTAVLAYMAVDGEHVVNTTGREITLPIVLLEPRDPFSGTLRLGFEISRLPSSLLDGPTPDKIDDYFLPMGQDSKLEAMARDRRLAALVAVDKAGNAAIKGLIIDGKLHTRSR
jgi:uncharacterized membrane-anchored protein